VSNEYSLGRLERAFLKKETAFGTIPAFATGDHVRLPGSFAIGQKVARKADQAKRDVAAANELFDLDKSTEWSWPEGPVRPAGVLGTPPELDVLFEMLLGQKIVANVSTTIAASPTPTTTGCTVAAAGALAKGCLIRFSNASKTGIHGQVRRVTSVSTNAITWEPALPAAPASGDTVTSGVTYLPVSDPEVSFAAVRDLGHSVEVFPGLWCNEGSLKFGRAEFLLASFSGQGCGRRTRVGAAALASQAAVGATTMGVTANEGELFDVSGGPWYARCEAEVVRIDGVSDDTLTVARAQQSTTAAGHDAGKELAPWTPARTLVGRAVTGMRGQLIAADSTGAIQAVDFETAEARVANGFEARRASGSEYAIGYYRADPVRAVTVNLTAKYKRTIALLRDAAARGRKVGLCMTVGEEAGYLAAVVLPRVVFDADGVPEAPEGGDTMITLTGTALASSEVDDDQIAIGFF
jgi:hypothetical protein